MPKVIPISGVVGWDIEARDIRDQIASAQGEDLVFEINSPGGSVFDGIEIYNIIKGYAGNTETRLISLGASMGSIIALAGKKKTALDTAVFMVHNPWSFSVGDYRDVQKDADLLKGLSSHMASLYAKETGKKKEEMQAIMDAESWYFGDQMAQFGIEIVETEIEKDEETAVAVAKLDFEAALNRMEKEKKEPKKGDIAALFAGINMETSRETRENNSMEVPNMDKAKLKAEFPGLYAEIVEEGRSEGLKAKDEAIANMREIFTAAGLKGSAIDAALSGVSAGEWALAEMKKEKDAQAKVETGIKGLEVKGQTPADSAPKDEADPVPVAQKKLDSAIDAIVKKKEAK